MKKKIVLAAVLSLIPLTAGAEPFACQDLGYVFDEGGCRDESSIVHCPMNPKLVWCIGGEMCGKYPVKGEACNSGAKIEQCNLTEGMIQANKRCRYTDESCNSCWEKGVWNGDNCGDSETCCKVGYDLQNGKCVEHYCDKTRYPYDIENYTLADYAGEIETCQSGNVIHFGYTSCNSMWQRASEDENDAGYYKCLCKRTDYENGYGFPFDKSTYYTTFAKGTLGDNHMCADAEASYYGYTHCFRGYEMVRNNGNATGECRRYFSMDPTITDKGALILSGSTANMNSILAKDVNLTEMAATCSKGKCQCFYDEVCTEENDKYEECTFCLSPVLNYAGQHFGRLSYRAETNSTQVGFVNGCPYDYQIFIGDSIIRGNPTSREVDWRDPDWIYYGFCYGECAWGDKACRRFDIVIKDGRAVGMVYRLTNSSSYSIVGIKLSQPFNMNYRTVNGVTYSTGWDAAMAYAAAYTPGDDICPVGSGCEAGQWQLPPKEDVQDNELFYGTLRAMEVRIVDYYKRFRKQTGDTTNYNIKFPIWSSWESADGSQAYMKNDWASGMTPKNTTTALYAHPVLEMEVH